MIKLQKTSDKFNLFVSLVKLIASKLNANENPINQDFIQDIIRFTSLARFKEIDFNNQEEIDFNNQNEIIALVLVKSVDFPFHSLYWKFGSFASESLDKIDLGNQTAVAALIRLISCTKDDYMNSGIHSNAVSILKTILTKPLMPKVVYALKNCQTKQSVEILWHCAQNLSYPQFYQAWHNPPITPHPEVPETKTIGTTPTTSNLNLAQLPQLLHTTINQNPELKNQIHLICIDASNFINQEKDNPALRIYTQMQETGYPEWKHGIPTDMSQLHNYWRINIANWEQKTVLIFYENPTVRQPQGFSDILLEHLNTFGGAICIICDRIGRANSRAKQNNLQYFSPTQSQLVENIINWIQRTVLEQ
jgi:hypothetical protein